MKLAELMLDFNKGDKWILNKGRDVFKMRLREKRWIANLFNTELEIGRREGLVG